MSHYFKRENDFARQGGESNSSHIVPIFNTKKRRVKQALYSNPASSQETNSSFSSVKKQFNPEIRTHFASTQEQEDKKFTTNRNAVFKTDSKMLVKQEKAAPKKLPCMPKPRPQFGVGGTSLETNPTNKKEEIQKSKPKDNHRNENVHSATKEPREMKTKVKMCTATIQKVIDWEEFRDKSTAVIVFEVFGVLESAVSSNPQGNAKSFLLRDKTNSMRVVGSLDRRTKSFHCVNIRPANSAEEHSAESSAACSDMAMQIHIATFKED